MKTPLKKIMTCFLLSLTLYSEAQNKKQSLTVLNIDVQGLNMSTQSMGSLVRTELEKLDTFAVTDKYDILYLLEKTRFASVAYSDSLAAKNRYKVIKISGTPNSLFERKDTLELVDKYNSTFFAERNKQFVNSCFGKLCLVEIGNTIGSEKMLSGSVERYGKTIVVTLRLIDVRSKSIEKTYVKEFLNFPEEIQNIISVAMRQMFGYPVSKDLIAKLTEQAEFDNTINNPGKDRLCLDGPRLGGVFYTGEMAARLMESKTSGGFDAIPLMFQFGYQFEKQYLNEGRFQALFEFIPMITGVDQGYFIPSLTLLHGFRDNVHGWEFALGPTINLITTSKGYYDQNNNWQLQSSWETNNGSVKNPYPVMERLDSRGEFTAHTGFVFAIGRTFKSGRLNMPVNLFYIPGRHGSRLGISIGFNAKNK
ncbi:hypothetical protein CNR22_17970 [Sphingobacteriaceae bacterium]|nr:hypothetical protein CNR22_17970 [Sphingobacteriaceae bacterium]